jgi:thiol:disulfide interchange protein DsbD
LNYQVCKEVCINLEKKFTFHQMMQWQLLGKKELKMVPVGTGTVMEDALEPSLGASNSSCYTRKGVVAAPKSATKRGLWSIFLLLSDLRFTNSLCFPMIPMTVSFLPSKVKQSERH